MERIRIHFTFSLAVGLVDAFSGLPPADPSIEVRIPGVPRKPLRKHDGYWVFSNLPAGKYRLEIASRDYHGKCIDVSAGMKTSLYHIPLFPRPTYAYPLNTTGVRLMVMDEGGRAQSDVYIRATPLAKDGFLARTLESLKKGDRKARISGKTLLLARGDMLYVTNQPSGEGEYVVIQDKDDEEGWMEFAEPIQGAYRKGAVLFLVSQGVTSERGEAVLGFRYASPGGTPVRLQLGRCGKERELVLNVSPGTIHNIGNVIL